MRRASALAAGLLSLTLAAACSQGETQRPAAAPGTDLASPSSAATASAPTLGTVVTVSPSAAGTSPAPVTTRPDRTPAPTAAAASPAAAPRTAAPRTAAPAPTTTQRSSPANSSAAPRPPASSAPAASPSRTPAPASQFALTIKDFAFSPRLLTIPVGSTVTVTNQDEATHDWTSRSSVWRSGDLQQGDTYSFTFPTSGTFDYLCERHPQMTGTVTVRPG